MKDYYELLGVSKSSSAAEIKSAYRKLALKWHPDRNKSTDTTAKFQEITKAYEVLSDPQKKQTYDQFGREAFERGGHGGANAGRQGGTYIYSDFGGQNPFEGVDFGGFSDPFDIFEQFFGHNSQGRRQAQQKIYRIVISFMEAVRGVEKEVKIEGVDRKIKIPAGIDDGMRMRFNEFDLMIEVRPDARFKRQGQDIYVEKEIPYTLAVLGGTLTVETLGKPVTLKVRQGTRSGSAVRLRGEGIPHVNSTAKGDMYVVYNIKVPERVSSQAKKLLEQLQKELL